MTAAKSPNGVVLAIALCLGALHLHASDGTAASSEPLPTGVTACAFDALANDPQPLGLAIHDAPRSDAPVLGRLPAIRDADASAYGRDGEIPEFSRHRFQARRLPIQGAAYQEPFRAKLYAGRRADGKLITTHMFRLYPENAQQYRSRCRLSLRHRSRGILRLALQHRSGPNPGLLGPMVRGRALAAGRTGRIRRGSAGRWNGAGLDGQILHATAKPALRRCAVRLFMVAAAARREANAISAR